MGGELSEHKGPRPVAWEGWHAVVAGEPPRGGRAGMVDVQEFDGDEPRCDYAMAPDEAERHALALIMAAAVARGERGHTAALSRVAAVLDASRPMAEAYRQSLNAINHHLGEPVAELVTLPPHVADVVAERDRLRVGLERAIALARGRVADAEAPDAD